MSGMNEVAERDSVPLVRAVPTVILTHYMAELVVPPIPLLVVLRG